MPHAWTPLLEARSSRGIAPLQFAFAGMNAHINRDLPVALVSTCRELGVTLEEGSPQHADFERVNDLLATVEGEVKSQYLTGWLRTLDRLVHRVDRIDDVVAMWNVQARPRRRLDERGSALGDPRRRGSLERLPRDARPDGRSRGPRAAGACGHVAAAAAAVR